MIVLPSAYLPQISYIEHIVASPTECTIDLGEHYIKRSLRNRTRITTSQGVMELSIPIRRANTPRQPMHSIEIDNSKRWQHQHWNAIIAAYKSSPYFDYYAPYFEPIYRREWSTLVELNSELLGVIMRLLGLGRETLVAKSMSYIEPQEGMVDLRPKGSISPSNIAPYIQVFSDRQPFEADLSILDLLFCEGTNALALLEASRR